MAHQVLAAFNIHSEDVPSVRVEVIAYFDEDHRPIGAVKVETDIERGYVETWAWLGGPTAVGDAMRAAIGAAGWGGLLNEAEYVPANDYRKVQLI